MQVTRLEDHIYLIDAETAGIKNFIASYIIKGSKVAMVETGPTSSVPNLLAGLEQLNVKLEDIAYVAVSHNHLDHGGGGPDVVPVLAELDVPAGGDVLLDVGLARRLHELLR